MRNLVAAGFMAMAIGAMSMTGFAGAWQQDGSGWWYQNDDGSYPANIWKQIEGKWYYFCDNGYIAENQWVDASYYVGADGAMMINTTTPDGYKVGADGKRVNNGSDAKQNGTSTQTESPRQEALKAYAEILRNYKPSYTLSAGPEFMILDIDGGETPELGIVDSGAHLCSVDLYNYVNGQANFLGDYGGYGTVNYNPGRNDFGAGDEHLCIIGTTMQPFAGFGAFSSSFGYTNDKSKKITEKNIEKMLSDG